MNNKNTLKNKVYLLEYETDDETDVVSWIEKSDFYNCGCCDNCLCYDNITCSNCGCNCNNYEIEDDEEYETEENNEDSNLDNKPNKINNISSFNINIINNKNKGKKVRLTLQLNIDLNNKKELITIEVDINKSTYLKIEQELFK